MTPRELAGAAVSAAKAGKQETALEILEELGEALSEAERVRREAALAWAKGGFEEGEEVVRACDAQVSETRRIYAATAGAVIRIAERAQQAAQRMTGVADLLPNELPPGPTDAELVAEALRRLGLS
jgi:hypothetical protein